MKSIDWKTLLQGSFAYMAAPFAVHPLDNQRARKMFHAAMNEGASIGDIIQEAETYLRTQGCTEDFIKEQIKSIHNYPNNPRKKLKSKKAWLITKVGANLPEEEIILIINSRKSSKAISLLIEQLYISSEYTPAEKLIYAKSPKDNPYQAEYHVIGGKRWSARITCGHNPYYCARIVTNLAIIESNMVEELVWEEIEIPQKLGE